MWRAKLRRHHHGGTSKQKTTNRISNNVDLTNYFVSVYISSNSSYLCFAFCTGSCCTVNMGRHTARQEQRVTCVSILSMSGNFWYFVCSRDYSVKRDTLVVVYAMKHAYHACPLLWSSQDSAELTSTMFPRPRCGSKFMFFVLFVYRLLDVAAEWLSRGWYRDGRKVEWREAIYRMRPPD